MKKQKKKKIIDEYSNLPVRTGKYESEIDCLRNHMKDGVLMRYANDGLCVECCLRSRSTNGVRWRKENAEHMRQYMRDYMRTYSKTEKHRAYKKAYRLKKQQEKKNETG